MTNPIKPTQPANASAVKGATSTAATQAAAPTSGAQKTPSGFSVQAPQGAQPVSAAAAAATGLADPLQTAIREVAEDIKAGRVPDSTAASEAVIIRLVNLRFGHLSDASKRKMTLHLQEMLHRDPFFQSRIDGLLRVAHQ
jgi:hypothetical protein